jgi:hypothetical protein
MENVTIISSLTWMNHNRTKLRGLYKVRKLLLIKMAGRRESRDGEKCQAPQCVILAEATGMQWLPSLSHIGTSVGDANPAREMLCLSHPVSLPAWKGRYLLGRTKEWRRNGVKKEEGRRRQGSGEGLSAVTAVPVLALSSPLWTITPYYILPAHFQL